MKRLMVAVLALPLLTACWWNKEEKKADVVETTMAQEAPASEASENADVAAEATADESSDEK